MKVNILTGNMELANSLIRHLRYVMGIEEDRIHRLIFGKEHILSKEILDADFWIAEAWNPLEPENPEGFRTLMKLSGRAKCLILFLFMPSGFPPDGSFWCKIPCNGFKQKIKKAMESAPPDQKDYQALVEMWPELAYDPTKHAHH